MTNAKPTIHASQNLTYGFWGSMNEHASAAWPLACEAVTAATGCEPEQVRVFLDSRHGRHFADDVLHQLYAGHTLCDAINAATQQWMDWRISRQTSKDYGIPKKLPYLTGFVIHCAVVAEMETT